MNLLHIDHPFETDATRAAQADPLEVWDGSATGFDGDDDEEGINPYIHDVVSPAFSHSSGDLEYYDYMGDSGDDNGSDHYVCKNSHCRHMCCCKVKCKPAQSLPALTKRSQMTCKEWLEDVFCLPCAATTCCVWSAIIVLCVGPMLVALVVMIVADADGFANVTSASESNRIVAVGAFTTDIAASLK